MNNPHRAAFLLSVLLFGAAGCSHPPVPAEPKGEIIGAQPRSLVWLKSEQNSDGSWGTAPEAQPALTSLAILAFLSYGETPASEEFGKCVENGMRRLLAWTETGLPADTIENEIISTDAIFTWSLCATYEMTCIPMFMEPASNAVQRLVSSTNQTPWTLLALREARFIDHVTGVTRERITDVGTRDQKDLLDPHGKGKDLFKGIDSEIYTTAIAVLSLPSPRTLPMFQVPRPRRDPVIGEDDIIIEIDEG